MTVGEPHEMQEKEQVKAVPIEVSADDDEEKTDRSQVVDGVDTSLVVTEHEGKAVSFTGLFRYATGFDKMLNVVGIISAIITGAMLPTFSYFFGAIVETAADADNVGQDVTRLAVWMSFAGGCAFVSGFFMMSSFIISSERQTGKIRTAFFSSLLKQEPGWFDLQKTGTLTSRLHGDTQIIHSGIGEKAGYFFMHTSTIVTSYIIAFYVSWRLTLVLLGAAPIIAVAGTLLHHVLTTMTDKTRAAYGKAGAVAEEVLSSMRTVHSLSAHSQKITAYTKHLDEARDSSKTSGVAQGLGVGVTMFIFFGTYTVGFIYASYLIKWGISDLSDILTAFFSIVIGSFSLGQIPPPVAAFAQARAAAFKIFNVIDRQPRVQEGKTKLKKFSGNIDFNKLTFVYPSRHEKPVFRDLNLHIPAGKSTALVGLSGCGKSTIVSIVERFYEPHVGQYSAVQLDGSKKNVPYEINLTLLDANAYKNTSEKTSITLPITTDGKFEKDCIVQNMKLLCPESDGNMRFSGTNWLWVEDDAGGDKSKEVVFELSQRMSVELTTAMREHKKTVQLDFSFGRYEIDLNKRKRTNIPVDMEYTQNGSVTVDGTPIGELDLEWWRDQVGMVTQEPVLFQGTILENIRMGSSDASIEDVKKACTMANISQVIERWPDKYNTKVGEGGCKLSGGQKQRVAIARAIIKKPKFLILDEATSALDRSSEIQVQQALDSLENSYSESGHERPTTIVIAHRLQSIMKSDKIVVMSPPKGNNGATIVEMGTHKELLQKEGHYESLWNTQNRSTGTCPDDDSSDEDADSVLAEDDKPLEAEAELQSDIEIEAKKKKVKNPLMRVIRLAAPWKHLVWLGFLGCLLAGATYPVYAYIFTESLDTFRKIGSNAPSDAPIGAPIDTLADRNEIDVWAYLYLAVGGIALVGNALQFAVFGYMGEMLTHRIRQMLFAHLLRQDMGFYDLPDNESGALAAMLSGKTEAINKLFGPQLGMIIRTVCCLGMGLGIAFSVQWKLTLVVFAAIPFLAISGFINIKLISGGLDSDKNSAAGRVTSEAISNIKTVVCFNGAGKLIKQYEKLANSGMHKKNVRGLGIGITFGLSQFSMLGSFALALWYGGKLIDDGETTFRSVILVVMEVTMSAMGVGETMGMQGDGLDATQAAHEVFSLLDTLPTIDQRSDKGKRDCISKSSIELSDINFSYPTRPSVKILDKISLSIPSPGEVGQQIGLIGGTGSGKSTIMQLLQRFYEIPSGMITVDGTNLKEIDLQYWRRHVAVVSQEPVLFNDTIRNNILLGNPSASESDVIAAAKIAHIHDTISKLPDQYDTIVGAKGSMLSGGQKQRVAIARAIIKNPKVMLLDEATSALDNESERDVQLALDSIIATRSMTTITIAHKLTTIRNASCITVLDKGKIVEQGTHEELMQIDNGDYKTRYNLYHSLDNNTPNRSPKASSMHRNFNPADGH